MRTSSMKVVAAFALILAACSSRELLTVEDPDIINPGAVNSPAGASALFSGAIGQFSFAIVGDAGGTEGQILVSGSMADELVNSETFPTRLEYELRASSLQNGTLLTVFGRADIEHGLGQIYAARSADEGRTWQPPVLIDSRPIRPEITDETGAHLPDSAFPSTAVAPDGSVYVAIEDNTSARSGTIDLARSRDGGRTWTSAPLPGVSAFAFQPSIAVDSHGTIGVTWYDLRNDRPGDAALSADVWFAQSADRGASWRQAHVAGPTNLRTAPLPAHNYVGEYQGLAALPGRGFAAIFTLAAPQARNGPTDIFFARIGPG